jgi:hypothetical protein
MGDRRPVDVNAELPDPHNRSDLSNLRERAEDGDEEAADELIELATERGDMDELLRSPLPSLC